MGQNTPEWSAQVDLPPQHIGVLQGVFASCLQGLQRDLQRGERLPERCACLRESAAFTRLLAGLELGVIWDPDEDACKALMQLAVSADETNGYAAAAAEYDALHGFLDRLKGKGMSHSSRLVTCVRRVKRVASREKEAARTRIEICSGRSLL